MSKGGREGEREGGEESRRKERKIGRNSPFLRGPVEVGAVVDCCLFGWGAAEDFGLPGVKVGVEVDD